MAAAAESSARSQPNASCSGVISTPGAERRPAAALMQTLGLKRTLLAGLVLMSASTALSLFMAQPWQYVATWGVLSGLGSGAVALSMGATVVNRWFVRQRGLVMGLLSASTATGSLVCLPAMAALAQTGGWKPVVITISLAAAFAALAIARSGERPATPVPV